MARCESCGSENLPGARYCFRCGSHLGGRSTVPGKCVNCGTINPIDVKRCTGCGALLADLERGVASTIGYPAKGQSGDEFIGAAPHRTGVAPSSRLTVAAVLLIVAGVLSLLQGTILFVMEPYLVEDEASGAEYMVCCGTFGILLGLGSVAGGYFAMKGSSFGLAVVGCLCAMASFGLAVGTVLGIVALVLVASRREEFSG